MICDHVQVALREAETLPPCHRPAENNCEIVRCGELIDVPYQISSESLVHNEERARGGVIIPHHQRNPGVSGASAGITELLLRPVVCEYAARE